MNTECECAEGWKDGRRIKKINQDPSGEKAAAAAKD